MDEKIEFVFQQIIREFQSSYISPLLTPIELGPWILLKCLYPYMYVPSIFGGDTLVKIMKRHSL